MQNVEGKWYPTVDENSIRGFFGEYRWLSNFHQCDVFGPGGLTYPSSEHAYMASKTLDHELHHQIKDVPTAAGVKKLGRLIPLRANWEDLKVAMMFNVVMSKFLENPDLAEKLLETGDKLLEETNYWNDTFWGVCNGVGKNKLGKVLMAVRDELRIMDDVFELNSQEDFAVVAGTTRD